MLSPRFLSRKPNFRTVLGFSLVDGVVCAISGQIQIYPVVCPDRTSRRDRSDRRQQGQRCPPRCPSRSAASGCPPLHPPTLQAGCMLGNCSKSVKRNPDRISSTDDRRTVEPHSEIRFFPRIPGIFTSLPAANVHRICANPSALSCRVRHAPPARPSRAQRYSPRDPATSASPRPPGRTA
jgi:hypothetical protein